MSFCTFFQALENRNAVFSKPWKFARSPLAGAAWLRRIIFPGGLR
jgi:hypothetical protein